MKRMRSEAVVLVSHGFQSAYERGFSNGLARNGLRATLISSDRTDYSALDRNVATVNLRGSQEEGRARWTKLSNMVWYHLRFWWFVLRNSHAIVHTIGLIEPVWLCGILEGGWIRLCAKRYVLTVHNLLPHGRHTRRNMALYRIAYQLPHFLVVHTEKARRDLVAQFGVDERKLLVMEHGLEPLEPDALQSLSAAGAHSPLRLLFFGYVVPYKGLDLLLRALEGVDTEFVLSIEGQCVDGRLRGELEKQIRGHSRVAAINWRNEFVSESRIRQAFLWADALVMPYRHIDQSGVLFQALRYGLPVIASDVGQLARYIDESKGELCAPNDTASLRAAIERFAKRRHTFSRRGIAQSALQYGWDRTVRDVLRCYE